MKAFNVEVSHMIQINVHISPYRTDISDWWLGYHTWNWMSLDFTDTDDKSTFVQAMAWCLQATSHYLSQCWPRSMLPYGVIGQQSINTVILLQCQITIEKQLRWLSWHTCMTIGIWNSDACRIFRALLNIQQCACWSDTHISQAMPWGLFQHDNVFIPD